MGWLLAGTAVFIFLSGLAVLFFHRVCDTPTTPRGPRYPATKPGCAYHVPGRVLVSAAIVLGAAAGCVVYP